MSRIGLTVPCIQWFLPLDIYFWWAPCICRKTILLVSGSRLYSNTVVKQLWGGSVSIYGGYNMQGPRSAFWYTNCKWFCWNFQLSRKLDGVTQCAKLRHQVLLKSTMIHEWENEIMPPSKETWQYNPNKSSSTTYFSLFYPHNGMQCWRDAEVFYY